MDKKVVIAIGGNALGNNIDEQRKEIEHIAKIIADLTESGNQIIITHGNGPQVGMIHTAMAEGPQDYPDYVQPPMSVSVSMSQAYIGYDLQNQIHAELERRGSQVPVSTILTQVRVDENDPAFEKPTKPIGRFYTEEEIKKMEDSSHQFIEDSGRGYRQVIASPVPQEIIEMSTIRSLVESGQIVITCGGGGIPVIKKDGELKGVNAVIDKDFASALLAKELDVDFLVILTAVEKVAINFGKENQSWLSEMTIDEAKEYIVQEQFAPGSMLPKIEAAMEFSASKVGRITLITELDKAEQGIAGETGTRIYLKN
jgi:Carbamate kinase